jgi:pimeloyl-ACP methyl ester carboxylesterase
MKKEHLFPFLFFLSSTVLAQIQPAQPATGYGGLASTYSSIVTFNCDDGATGYMLFTPASPHAATLPLVVFDHGFGEWNPLRYGRWIEHMVKRGNIVIFPRYQKDEYVTPSTSFTPNAVTGILRAIDTIQHHPTWTQPDLSKVFYVGHSYGGLISANLATKYASYAIPKPKGILMACPGYGSYPGGQLSSYAGMDSSIFVLDIFERNDNVVDSTFALQVFNQTTAVPYAHKNLVIHFADSTGTPHITSTHGESSCIDSTLDNGDRGIVMSQASYAYTDATDFYCYWKLFDALEDCALNGNGCTTAFGDTYAQEYMGLWSNGVPVRPLDVRPINLSTSVPAYKKEGMLNIYPNPFTDNIHIAKGTSSTEEMEITLFNILGEQIGHWSFSQQINTLNLSSLNTGSYFIRVRIGNNTWNKQVIRSW